MKLNLWLLTVSAALAVSGSSLIYGAEVGFPAAQIEKGKCSLLILSGSSAEKLNFKVTSRDEIKIGNNSYFSEVSNDLESDGRSRSALAKLLFNPEDGLYYWLKAGTGDYDLEIPSANSKNKLSGQDKGWICGFGARKLLFPDTIVTPAIAVDLGVSYSSYGLDSFRSGSDAPAMVNDKLEITEVQTGLIISKKLRNIEPYGGLKIYRKLITLTDKTSFQNVSGTKDNAGLFFGMNINFYQREALVIEASLVGDTGFNAGLSIGF